MNDQAEPLVMRPEHGNAHDDEPAHERALGAPLPHESAEAHVSGEARYGVGMANVRTRLQSLYGSGFRLTVENQQPDGVEVAVSLPYVQR